MSKTHLDFALVREMAMTLADVEESTIHGAPSLRVRGKLMTCPALHASVEPNTLAVRISLDQRARLMAAEPGVYYVTEHYRNYPTVLVRLSRIDRDALRELLRMSWQFVSSKRKSTGRAARTGSRERGSGIKRDSRS